MQLLPVNVMKYSEARSITQTNPQIPLCKPSLLIKEKYAHHKYSLCPI